MARSLLQLAKGFNGQVCQMFRLVHQGGVDACLTARG